MHGVRRELLARQAEVLGIPLVEVVIPAACVNEIYEARMAEAFAAAPLSSVKAVAFGDLFRALAREFLDAGFEATLVCVDPRALDAAFAGRRYDERLLAELPPGVDPCGENGEFHTFVSGARSSPSRSPARPERSSSATGSSSAT